MTQISRPQPEHQNSGYLDSGPYSADQWAELYKILFTRDNAAAQGPFEYVLNELAVTNPSGSDIQVNTGWGICNGHLLKADAAVTFSPASPSANPRIDVVVVVENNTAVARTAGIASGNALVFPTSLTDYDGLSSLPPYTCRLAILQGTEAGSPTAPTLDVDTATLFMVPLAQYQISTGGVVSALTNRREFAGVVDRTRRLWLSAGALFSTGTLGADVLSAFGWPSWNLADAAVREIYGSFRVPADYNSGNLTVKLWWICDKTGNARLRIRTIGRAVTESALTAAEIDSTADYAAATAAPGTPLVTVSTLSTAVPVAAGDMLFVRITRDATHANDTLNDVVYALGIEVEYTANS
jgi:hypothetical protein